MTAGEGCLSIAGAVRTYVRRVLQAEIDARRVPSVQQREQELPRLAFHAPLSVATVPANVVAVAAPANASAPLAVAPPPRVGMTVDPFVPVSQPGMAGHTVTNGTAMSPNVPQDAAALLQALDPHGDLFLVAWHRDPVFLFDVLLRERLRETPVSTRQG
jgi:hypothetical protein